MRLRNGFVQPECGFHLLPCRAVAFLRGNETVVGKAQVRARHPVVRQREIRVQPGRSLKLRGRGEEALFRAAIPFVQTVQVGIVGSRIGGGGAGQRGFLVGQQPDGKGFGNAARHGTLDGQ